MAADIPQVSLAAVEAIADTNTRQVLRNLVAGWNTRNGVGTKSFVTPESFARNDVARALGNAVSTQYVKAGPLIDALQASVLASAQFQALGTGIDLVTEAVDGEVIKRIGGDNSLASAINTLWASVGSNSALVQTGNTIAVNDVSAIATKFSQVQAAITGGDGNLIASAALRTEQNATASTVTGLSGQYSVKIDLNGYVAGFGLSSTVNNSGNASSSFIIRADRFAVGSPGQGNIVPFIVQASATYLNGQYVPAGVYVSELFVKNGSIDNLKVGYGAIQTANIVDGAIVNAKIGDAQITTAKIGDLQVSTLKIGLEAVTVPSTGSGADSCSVTITPSGGKVAVFATGGGRGGATSAAYANIGVILYKNGGEVARSTTQVQNDGTSYNTVFYIDSPPSGVGVTYSASAFNDLGTILDTRTRMYIQEAKR